MQRLHLALVFLSLTALSGCGTNQQYRAIKQNFDIVFNQPPTAELSWQQIAERESDLLRIRLADSNHAYLSLMVTESGVDKYRSSNNVVFIFQQGRLVRTSGLKDDLVYSEIKQEPLATAFSSSLPAAGVILQDWQSAAGYSLALELNLLGAESFTALGKTVTAIKYTETVRLNEQVVGENLYWFSADGVLLKSIQTLQSEQRQIEILWLSQIHRHAL
ncbi:YjbF family lipoprotein [Alishewanella longhuensis]